MKWSLLVLLAACDQTFGFQTVLLPDDGRGVDSSIDAPPAGAWKSIAAGEDHACGITTAGALYCFGSGIAGHGSQMPVAIAPGQVYAQVVSAGTHSCGLSGSAVYCWGHENDNEVLANGTGDYTAPQHVQIGEPSAVTEVETGVQHSCALLANGHVWCWGGGQEIGASTGIAMISGTPPGIQRLSLGLDHSCALTTTAIYCWGDNGQSQCTGDGTSASMIGPSPVVVTGTPLAIAAGREMTCAIVDQSGSARLVCWGKDMFGSAPRTARLYSIDADWQNVVIGDRVICGFKGDGAHCMGVAMAGGFGDDAAHNIPPNTTTIAIAGQQISLSLGDYNLTDNEHACSLTDGHVTCWSPEAPTAVADPM